MQENGLPIGWEKKRFGDVAKIRNGFAFSSKDFKEKKNESDVPLIKQSQLDGDRVDLTNCDYLDHGFIESHAAWTVKKGDVLVGMSGSIGKLCIYDKDFPSLQNQRTGLIQRLDKTLSQKFFWLVLLLIEEELREQSKGVGVSNISSKSIEAIEIVIPPVEIREKFVSRIEELFSELDKGVEALQKTKDQLKVYRQAVLKEAFEFKNGWQKVRASDIGEIKLGRQRSPQNISKDYPTSYIRAANITEKGLALNEVFEMEFTPTEQEKFRLQKDDILLSEASGSALQVGKPALWNEEIPNCCFQNTVIRHRVENVLPRYVYWHYMYYYISGYFSKIVGGVGINHLGAKGLSNVQLFIAPQHEQNRIVEGLESKLSICERIEQTVYESLIQSEKLRQSILKNAFDGNLI